MAETKGMTITEPDDENDASLKICYQSCKYKSKKYSAEIVWRQRIHVRFPSTACSHRRQ